MCAMVSHQATDFGKNGHIFIKVSWNIAPLLNRCFPRTNLRFVIFPSAPEVSPKYFFPISASSAAEQLEVSRAILYEQSKQIRNKQEGRMMKEQGKKEGGHIEKEHERLATKRTTKKETQKGCCAASEERNQHSRSTFTIYNRNKVHSVTPLHQ